LTQFQGKTMRCSNCGSDNPAGKKFCSECGAGFSRGCPRCGAENAPAAKFCGDCGAELSPPVQPPVAEASPVQPRDTGERRHLTVLFCDLAGSTGIAAQLDPEEWRETVSSYHRAAAEAITRFGGHVAKYLGDGVMAFFGYPEAHDDDAERAARAGLAILDAMARFNEQPTHPKLSARIGIHSGAVVMGAGATKDVDVFGDAPNIAARVQAAAEPDTVLLTDATHRLVSGLFIAEDRGAHSLKGVEQPVQLYRVVQPSGVRGRLEAAAASRGLTPFVGREDELRSLMNRWERALEGEGQVALIIGEAGIGKSRLVQRFHEQIAGTPHTWVAAAAGAFFQSTPFYPVTEMLRELLAWHGDHSAAEEQLSQLEPRLELAGLKPAEAIPLIAPLLNLPLPADYPPSTLSPEQQRRRLLATLVEWVLGTARAQPTVIATEDLHWADPSTLELIQLLTEQGATARLLLLYTARPEFHPWPLRAHHTQITLNRLSTRNVRSMVEEVAARKAMSDETIATVVERTGGVPLFVEELTRAVLESGDAKFTGHDIPVTLHDSLMARLDRLGAAKEIIQIGAVIGGEFSYELLHAVHPIAEENLQRALRNVADAELLYVRGIAPDATYQFKHALIRDAAYEALLRSRRKELHSRIADVLAHEFSDKTALAPELLAHHYTEAGLVEEAIPAWQRAGLRAIERSANVEAISHFTKALELLEAAPDSPERVQQEARLQITLGGALMAIRGCAAPEAGKAYFQAADLCRQAWDDRQLFNALGGLVGFHMIRGELPTARIAAEELLSLAEKLRSPAHLQSAEYAMGEVLFHMRELQQALAHSHQAISLYHPKIHRFRPIHDPGVASLAVAACVLWHLGYPDQASKRIQEALRLARELNHPFSTAFAVVHAAVLHCLRREIEATQQQAETLIALSREQGFTLREAVAVADRGWALSQRGRTEEGIAHIRQGLADVRAAGAGAFEARLLTLLAEAYGAAGQAEAGLTALAEAFERISENGSSFVDLEELHRLKGELLLKQHESRAPEARACFELAIDLARKRSAKSLELRATTSLTHLLSQQGHREEARAMLAEIYGWFTEGFDTADLKDAKALLEELSR